MSPLRRPEIKPFREMDPLPIGIIFLAVMAALLLLSFNLDKLPFNSGTGYGAAFARADGLRKGDRVMVGGVVVGKVTGVSLEGTHVHIGFTVTSGGVHLGRDTTASIQIATLLGNKYLSLTPQGPGEWPSDRELPLAQTRSPFDVEPAFQGLASTVGRINTTQLADALDILATTFKDSPRSVRSMLSGLSRLSETISSRDTELGRLLHRADVLTGVLAERRVDFTKIFGDGDQLLRMLQDRQAVIASLLDNTAAMAQQLTGLVRDNQVSIKPALAHLHSVLKVLNAHQDNLDQIVKGLYVFVRGEVDATGSGPWFDGTAINATNPVQVGNVPTHVSTARPRSLGDLLGVPQARRAVAAGRHG
jgi:phospholipid/cholesterol/gamma-HCH transport system substrate-binding protein